jgi:hypothetical protein
LNTQSVSQEAINLFIKYDIQNNHLERLKEEW